MMCLLCEIASKHKPRSIKKKGSTWTEIQFIVVLVKKLPPISNNAASFQTFERKKKSKTFQIKEPVTACVSIDIMMVLMNA